MTASDVIEMLADAGVFATLTDGGGRYRAECYRAEHTYVAIADGPLEAVTTLARMCGFVAR